MSEFKENATPIVVLSGEIASGKTTLRNELVDTFGFAYVSTSDFLREGADNERSSLQAFGDKLDEETDGKWVVELVSDKLRALGDQSIPGILVDAVRKDFQIDRLREAFPGNTYHVHITAEPSTLQKRFELRQSVKEADKRVDYGVIKQQPTEVQVAGLGKSADLLADTTKVQATSYAVKVTQSINSVLGRPLPKIKRVIVLTGHTTNGKTRLAKDLNTRHGFHVVKSSTAIAKAQGEGGTELSRQDKKKLGTHLDGQSGCSWLFESVKEIAATAVDTDTLVVDAVRNMGQLEWFRKQAFFQVIHVHLYCNKATLDKRLRKRANGGSDDPDLIEQEEDIKAFKSDADVRISTERGRQEDTYSRVLAHLGIVAPPDRECVDVLVGGQFGSEGKGHVAAHIAREYDVLMRVGGPNAGHTVSSESGVFTYHHLPSGCRDANADVLIGPGATINIHTILEEIEQCGLNKERVYIDPQAMVIAEEHCEQEGTLKGDIGSTGSGSGAASAGRIVGRLTSDPNRAKLVRDYLDEWPTLRDYVKPTHDRLQKAFLDSERVLLEGTQGSGLSIFHGQYPFVTSRDTNVMGCLAEAGIPPARVRRVIMVVRYTPIRVANPDGTNKTSGSLMNEVDVEQIAEHSGLDVEELKKYEKTSTTGRDRRFGWFEWDSFRKACELNCPTDIFLTFADYINVKNRSARRFDQLTEATIRFIDEIERVGQARVSLINTRFQRDLNDDPDLRSVIDRRDWKRLSK